MNETENIAEALRTVFQWGARSSEIKHELLGRDDRAGQVALVPEGMVLTDLKPYLPQRPEWKIVARKFLDLDSFVAYVNEQKSSFSRIYGKTDKAPYLFKAIIDHCEPAGGKADWEHHTAELALELSDNFKLWSAVNGKLMTQIQFSEFLKDNRLDISSPDNAGILEIVMDLEASADSKCVGKVPTNTGMAFSFREDVNASVNGKKVDIPTSIRLKMPVFLGMGEEEIECEFRFRLANGEMAFGIRMIGVDRMLRLAVMAARERIKERTELPVYI